MAASFDARRSVMKHHVLVSRMPARAQTDYEPGDTSTEAFWNFLAAFAGQLVQFVFSKTGGTL